MRNQLIVLICSFSTCSLFAQHLYEIDLNKIEKDVLPVKMSLNIAPQTDQVTYSFPATVPGTYDTQDFGRFVLSMNAKTADGKKLKVKKQGNNSFIISDAKKLKYLEYTLEDIMDRKVKKHPIFDPDAPTFTKAFKQQFGQTPGATKIASFK
jgi:predicted metalloprotease with PDZ domain